MKRRHVDDFALLRLTAGDLDETERGTIRRHLDECDACFFALMEVRQVDSRLREIGGYLFGEGDLPPNDPFRVRPARPWTKISGASELVERAVAAAERGSARVNKLLDTSAETIDVLNRFLRELSIADPATRFLLLYALEDAGRRSANNPARCLRFAEEVLARLEGEPAAGEAESMVPLSAIVGQAHLVAGQASNWTGALENARRHLESAYRSFPGESASDEIRLALTEYHESQRRSFAGRAAEGLVLARRARPTLELYGLDDYAVRARVAEGIALSSLGRDEEALDCYRVAAPVFERQGLWSNYVSAVNGLGASLARLGRLDEAKREYSRALRNLSREKNASLLAFTRNGLAHVLFSGGRYADAAKSFLQAAGLFQELDLTADALTASLWEIESWARSGDTARAVHRLELFRSAIGRLGALDPFVVEQLKKAVSGQDPDFERLAEICRRAEEAIRERFETQAG